MALIEWLTDGDGGVYVWPWHVKLVVSPHTLTLSIAFRMERFVRHDLPFILSSFVVRTLLTLPFFPIYLFLDQHYSAVKFRYQWTVEYLVHFLYYPFIHSFPNNTPHSYFFLVLLHYWFSHSVSPFGGCEYIRIQRTLFHTLTQVYNYEFYLHSDFH